MIRTFPHAKAEFYHNGLPVEGGTVKFFEAGTSTPKAVYSDYSRSTSLGSEVTLDAQGRAYIVLGTGNYDAEIYDSDDVLLYSEENYTWDFFTTNTGSYNPVCNASFEVDEDSDNEPDNWTLSAASGATITRDTTDSNHGTASLKIVNSGSAGSTATSCIFPVSSTRNYELYVDVKGASSTAAYKVKLKWLDGDEATVSTDTVLDVSTGVNTSWGTKKITGAVNSSAKYVQVILENAAVSDTVRFDNIEWELTGASSTSLPDAGFTPSGLEISNNSTDAEHDLDVSAGSVKAWDGSAFGEDIVLETAITKRFDASFAAGDGNGGDDGSSLPTDDIYYIFVIKDTDTGDVDVLGSTSSSSPTMPSGYDAKRRIGACATDSSGNIIGASWKGSRCILDELPTAELDSTSVTLDTWAEYTVAVPPNSYAMLQFNFEDVSDNPGMGNIRFRLRPTSSSASDFYQFGYDPDGSDAARFWQVIDFLVDGSSAFDFSFWGQDGGTPELQIYVLGWDDLERDNP